MSADQQESLRANAASAAAVVTAAASAREGAVAKAILDAQRTPVDEKDADLARRELKFGNERKTGVEKDGVLGERSRRIEWLEGKVLQGKEVIWVQAGRIAELEWEVRGWRRLFDQGFGGEKKGESRKRQHRE